MQLKCEVDILVHKSRQQLLQGGSHNSFLYLATCFIRASSIQLRCNKMLCSPAAASQTCRHFEKLKDLWQRHCCCCIHCELWNESQESTNPAINKSENADLPDIENAFLRGFLRLVDFTFHKTSRELKKLLTLNFTTSLHKDHNIWGYRTHSKAIGIWK